jgi:hypothetical protein
MFIESEQELRHVSEALQRGPSFWIPVFSDHFKHYTQNTISFVYIYSIADDMDFIVPARHIDCININIERLTELSSPHGIFVLSKKRFQNTYVKPCYDADLYSWWNTGRMLGLDETNTAAHDIWNKWWYNETNTNDWLPITRHLERCRSMRDVFMDVYRLYPRIADEFREYERFMLDNCHAIESNGLRVDDEVVKQHFNQVSTNGFLYTEYNPYTSTGRPSNKFGGINFAALNKDDGARGMIVSRFNRGMLLEFDFDAFHVRLIAELIGYTLPDESVHTYFGRQYFGKTDLTDEEYEQSKQMTFHLLYGGIDAEFEKIPFFGKTKRYITDLWRQYRKNGFITTPIFKRPITWGSITEPNAGKLFNYLLQSFETEHNMHVINDINTLLTGRNSKLVLYTYDSFLIDFDLNDGKDLIKEIKDTISHGNYPVKIKAGVNYHRMQDMTNKVC